MPEHNEHLLKWLDLQDLTYTREHWAGFLIDFLNDFLIGKKGQGKRLVRGNAGSSASIRSWGVLVHLLAQTLQKTHGYKL